MSVFDDERNVVEAVRVLCPHEPQMTLAKRIKYGDMLGLASAAALTVRRPLLSIYSVIRRFDRQQVKA
jgi:hypothetical protein